MPILVTSPKPSSQPSNAFVAGGVGLEALRAEQPAERVQGGSHMDVEVGVDATGDPTRSFYDGHWSSLLSMVLRDGTAVPDRSDGRSGLFRATRTNHPNSETGRAVFQCAAGRSRSTTSCNVTGLQVRPNLPALPKLFGTSSQAVDPQRSINVRGHSRLVDGMPGAVQQCWGADQLDMSRTTARWCSAWNRMSSPRSTPSQHSADVMALTTRRRQFERFDVPTRRVLIHH